MTSKLSDVIELIGGGTPKTSVAEYWGGDIPWLSVKDFNADSRYVYSTEKTITEAGLENSSTKLLDVDDIIISARGTVGELAMIPFPMAFNQSCYGIRGKKDKVVQTYLYYLLKDSIRLLKSQAHGSVFDTITRDTFATIDVDLPSLAEQQTIADTLAALDARIAENRAINNHLEQMAQAIFKSWFVDFEPFGGEMPSDWRQVPLGEVVEMSTKALNPQSCPDTILEHYSIPAFDETRLPVFEAASEIKSNKYIVDKDCFLISKLNPTTKRIWRPYCISRHAVCSTEFMVYRAKNRAHKDFYYSVIDSPAFTDFLLAHITGSTGSRQRVIPSETLSFAVVDPPDDIIEDFCDKVAAVYAHSEQNHLESRRLRQIRDSLLPRLMSGELSVANLGDDK